MSQLKVAEKDEVLLILQQQADDIFVNLAHSSSGGWADLRLPDDHETLQVPSDKASVSCKVLHMQLESCSSFLHLRSWTGIKELMLVFLKIFYSHTPKCIN